MTNYVKKEENTGKNRNLMEPGDENKIKFIKTDVESDGEDGGATREPKQEKCEKLKPNTDMTNDSIYNCTSASNIDNRKVTSTETKSVTTNDEGNNGEVSEAEMEAELVSEADTNSEKLNSSSNTGILGSSNSKSNYVENKILKPPDEDENKMIGNNVGYDGENPCETRETQQQQFGNAMSIANRTPNDDSNGEK